MVGERLIRRRRSRPQAAIERFTRRLGPPIPADELLLQLTEALRASLDGARAEAWLLEGTLLERAVSVPHKGEGDRIELDPRELRQLAKPSVYGRTWAEVWVPALLDGRESCSLRLAPVVNQGEVLGVLAVERPPGRDFTGAEERILGELARHLGLSLHNERLRAALEASLAELRTANEELRASRSRVVETADAERLRIERDLHDGAQQQLIAISIELRRARDALEPGQGAVAERLERAAEAADGAIDDLRDLAHGIYPQALRESGLPAALRLAARRHPAEVHLELGELGRHPAAIEAAVYFAVMETLANSAKHAAGASAVVRVGERGGEISFEVADDGPGFDLEQTAHGRGMVNLGDRIGAVGGSIAWDSSAGSGTKVSGTVPATEP